MAVDVRGMCGGSDVRRCLPKAWCKSSLKLNVGALADVDEKTLAKHDIKRDEVGKWKVTVERTTGDGKKLYGRGGHLLCAGF